MHVIKKVLQLFLTLFIIIWGLKEITFLNSAPISQAGTIHPGAMPLILMMHGVMVFVNTFQTTLFTGLNTFILTVYAAMLYMPYLILVQFTFGNRRTKK